MGQNPAVAGPNSRLERKALAKLQWLVVRDLVEMETASFWYDSPEIERGELRTEEIGTEIFLLPAAGHAEKDGCFTNTQRLIQWHEKAVDPPGDARSEPWFIYHLGRRLKEKARLDPRPRNAALNALTWDYSLSVEDITSRMLKKSCRKSMDAWYPTAALVRGYGGPEGRRFHLVRVLDLFRYLSRSRPKPCERKTIA